MYSDTDVHSLSDQDLLRGLHSLLRQSRRVEADLVAHIGEVDARRLFAQEAAPSMFVYCTLYLHLSEAEAYLRIEVARAARRHPLLLDMLRDGRLHLSGIVKLAPHLTAENRDTLLGRAAGRSKREIEELLAELTPRPDVPTSLRKLPEPRAATPAPAPTAPGRQLRPDGVAASSAPPAVPYAVPKRPAVVEPLAPARYRVEFTASGPLREKLERLLGLMRTADRDVDLAGVIDAAVSEKLERLLARRFATTSGPRKDLAETDPTPTSRHIPAPVRRAVYERDGGQCGYVDGQGRRCPERHDLEYHHRHPYGYGGDHSVTNVALLCTSHNRLLAEHDYGAATMARHRKAARTVPTPAPGIHEGLGRPR